MAWGRFTIWRSTRAGRVEGPTLGVAAVIYAGWLAVTLGHRHLPTAITVTALGVLGAWQTSLQHEVIHGHPFRSRAANHALAWLPVTLWVPYGDYRDSHLAHHRSPELTDPRQDPESFYVDPDRWATAGRLTRRWLQLNQTLAGRLALAPVVTTLTYWWWAVTPLRSSFRRRALISHVAGVTVVLVWVVGVCHLPLWVYAAGAWYLGRCLSFVRSFCEHRWVEGDGTRSAVVRAGRLWSLLFLNNNLHHTHHARPGAPWYRLPLLARSLGSDDLAAGGAGWYPGYGAVFRRYALRPFDRPQHPAHARTEA